MQGSTHSVWWTAFPAAALWVLQETLPDSYAYAGPGTGALEAVDCLDGASPPPSATTPGNFAGHMALLTWSTRVTQKVTRSDTGYWWPDPKASGQRKRPKCLNHLGLSVVRALAWTL